MNFHFYTYSIPFGPYNRGSRGLHLKSNINSRSMIISEKDLHVQFYIHNINDSIAN